jgi:uncharacterized protein YbjT (DUF2867 family)
MAMHESTMQALFMETTHTNTTTKTTLVLGSTGKTGRRVAKRLEERGLPVRRASRSGATPFDWNAPATWAPALEGVDAVYLSFYPDLAAPGAPEVIEAFAHAAGRAGVRRIVLLSGRGEPQAERCEKILREVLPAVALTVIRGAWFSQNFSEGELVGPVLSGEIAFPAGRVAEPFVDADDIADVAVAVLLDRSPGQPHAGKIYELTGPRLLTFDEVAAEISRASGRPVHYRPVTKEEYAAALSAVLPPDYASFLADLFAQVLDGRNACLSGDVERILGRKPRDFSDYVAANADTWRFAVAG